MGTFCLKVELDIKTRLVVVLTEQTTSSGVDDRTATTRSFDSLKTQYLALQPLAVVLDHRSTAIISGRRQRHAAHFITRHVTYAPASAAGHGAQALSMSTPQFKALRPLRLCLLDTHPSLLQCTTRSAPWPTSQPRTLTLMEVFERNMLSFPRCYSHQEISAPPPPPAPSAQDTSYPRPHSHATKSKPIHCT